MRIVTVVGARPQFIKAAAFSRVARARPDVEEILIHTGQHYDTRMSDVFFEELSLPKPDHHLEVGSGSHGSQTGRMLERIEAILLKARPDWVVVYGDTNSTLAGALAAVKLQLPVAHVEAGLRSFNRRMPEEINRVLTDHLAELLLAPTEAAVQNLAREGLEPQRIHLVGDLMDEAARYYAKAAERRSRVLDVHGLVPSTYVLATVHRAENTDDDDRLAAIFEGLCRVSTPVVVPLHPRTRAALVRAGLYDRAAGCLRLIEPVGYLDMVMLERHAGMVVTDSGGVQKEAFFYGVPCVVVREETEWVELVALGWNHLVPPTRPEAIAEAVLRHFGAGGGRPGQPFGDGRAAEAILERLFAARPVGLARRA